jgi:hypothetical protein
VGLLHDLHSVLTASSGLPLAKVSAFAGLVDLRLGLPGPPPTQDKEKGKPFSSGARLGFHGRVDGLHCQLGSRLSPDERTAPQGCDTLGAAPVIRFYPAGR